MSPLASVWMLPWLPEEIEGLGCSYWATMVSVLLTGSTASRMPRDCGWAGGSRAGPQLDAGVPPADAGEHLPGLRVELVERPGVARRDEGLAAGEHVDAE